jgi:hypothetical protein
MQKGRVMTLLTPELAKELKPGDMLHYPRRPTDGCERWKVNGQVQLWKRNSKRFRVPLKHGLYSFDQLSDTAFGNGSPVTRMAIASPETPCEYCGETS